MAGHAFTLPSDSSLLRTADNLLLELEAYSFGTLQDNGKEPGDTRAARQGHARIDMSLDPYLWRHSPNLRCADSTLGDEA